ncbi:MAG: DUF1934 family protein [Saccharofermentanaceae bacterium]|jgi:hypothetical protein|nr:DUF1934 family protein [Clostridia bacterium]NLX68165.1 DUF1934 domain-containing protein [Clostridiaceae bacterium]HOO48944.1 DUF1934 family protein [Saccharofermentans sp.]HPE27645.1 DUF1934 family protein [Saccharofermentans sp.]HPJ81309.1 DUF1934 family protein [Saccharofermentans sp.]
MRVPVEIVTGAMNESFKCMALYEDNDEHAIVKWKQPVDESNEESLFELEINKATGKATLLRKGSISSKLEFDPSKETIGTIDAACGTIVVNIVTDHINLPSVMCSRLEIAYSMRSSGTDVIKNTFLIKFLLQKKMF